MYFEKINQDGTRTEFEFYVGSTSDGRIFVNWAKTNYGYNSVYFPSEGLDKLLNLLELTGHPDWSQAVRTAIQKEIELNNALKKSNINSVFGASISVDTDSYPSKERISSVYGDTDSINCEGCPLFGTPECPEFDEDDEDENELSGFYYRKPRQVEEKIRFAVYNKDDETYETTLTILLTASDRFMPGDRGPGTTPDRINMTYVGRAWYKPTAIAVDCSFSMYEDDGYEAIYDEVKKLFRRQNHDDFAELLEKYDIVVRDWSRYKEG